MGVKGKQMTDERWWCLIEEGCSVGKFAYDLEHAHVEGRVSSTAALNGRVSPTAASNGQSFSGMFRSSSPLLRKSEPLVQVQDTIITAWTIRHPTRNRNDPIARAELYQLSYIPRAKDLAREVNHRTYGPTNWDKRSTQGKALAIRWLLGASRKRPGRNMAFKLSSELVDAAKGSGDAIRKKEETHRMAEANRAFAHFR
ncbi:hypothetical protein PVK06_001366 [Gossypium arboreum]|uniref:Small ribosomal subunit protein uS7 domain-containing protein n=1 Tax=Gossypium arboreum TaxID=29729 RepID=A0ABR0R101_GOSAR|nr:hypothetical protein PVK06_001366 [Gossypium arboreum]